MTMWGQEPKQSSYLPHVPSQVPRNYHAWSWLLTWNLPPPSHSVAGGKGERKEAEGDNDGSSTSSSLGWRSPFSAPIVITSPHFSPPPATILWQHCGGWEPPMCYCLFLSSCLIPSPVSLSMVYGQEGFEPNTPRSVLQHYNAMLALRKQWLYSRKFSDNVLENLKNNLAILF